MIKPFYHSPHLERSYYISLEDDGYCGSTSHLEYRCELEPGHGGRHEHDLPAHTYTWETNPMKRHWSTMQAIQDLSRFD